MSTGRSRTPQEDGNNTNAAHETGGQDEHGKVSRGERQSSATPQTPDAARKENARRDDEP